MALPNPNALKIMPKRRLNVIGRGRNRGPAYENTTTMIRSITPVRSPTSHQPEGWFIYSRRNQTANQLDVFKSDILNSSYLALQEETINHIRQDELDYVVIKCPFCNGIAYTWNKETDDVRLSPQMFGYMSNSVLIETIKKCPHCGEEILDEDQFNNFMEVVPFNDKITSHAILRAAIYGFRYDGQYFSYFGEPGTTALFDKENIIDEGCKLPTTTTELLNAFNDDSFEPCLELMCDISKLRLKMLDNKNNEVGDYVAAIEKVAARGRISAIQRFIKYIEMRRGKGAEIYLIMRKSHIFRDFENNEWREGPGRLYIASKELDIFMTIPHLISYEMVDFTGASIELLL